MSQKSSLRDRSLNGINIYLDEIKRIPLLSSEDEKALSMEMLNGRREIKEIEERLGIPKERITGILKRSQDGRIELTDTPLKREEIDELVERFKVVTKRIESARKRLIESNLRLVVDVARRYVHFGLPLLDLIDEGNLGLLMAVDRFDYRHGYRFSTYAVWWIRQVILRALSTKGRMIRIPVHLVESLNRYLRHLSGSRQRLGREPTLAEMAQEMGLSLQEIVKMTGFALESVSLDTIIDLEKEGRVSNLIEDRADSSSPEWTVFLHALREKIEELLGSLKERERMILRLRYGLNGSPPHTLEETGQILGMSRERVRQIEGKILDRLRKMRLTGELYDFLVEY